MQSQTLAVFKYGSAVQKSTYSVFQEVKTDTYSICVR